MSRELPPFVIAERDAIIAETYEAFAGVSRKGGISWSESDEVDNYGSLEARAKARALDTDTSWMQVVEDPKWRGGTGIGGWNFLDSIGFRYYLPVLIVKCLRGGEDVSDQCSAYALILPEDEFRDWKLDKWSLLILRERRCVKRFLQYMSVVDPYDWNNALNSYWNDISDDGEDSLPGERRRKKKRS